MQSRTNLIISHGGRHGVGGTYLRGAKIDRKMSENVPNRLLTGNSREVWAGEGAPTAPAARKATNADDAAFVRGSPEARALLEAIKQDEAKKAADEGTTPRALKVETTPPPPPPPAPAAQEKPQDPPPTKPKPPTSRRQLTVMRKTELIAMADAYEVDSDGTADAIRDRLRSHFFGEDDPEE